MAVVVARNRLQRSLDLSDSQRELLVASGYEVPALVESKSIEGEGYRSLDGDDVTLD